MNIPAFIVRRLFRVKNKTFTRVIIRICIIALSISLAAMIVGLSFVRGFQQSVKNKFYDVWGHIHITPALADVSNIYQESNFNLDTTLIKNLNSLDEVQKIQAFDMQSLILKSKTEMEGLILRTVLEQEDLAYLAKKYHFNDRNINDLDSTGIIISDKTAKKLQVKIGDKLIAYFLFPGQARPALYRFYLKNIYDTGLDEFDNGFVFCGAKALQKARNDSSIKVQLYQIELKNNANTKALSDSIYFKYLEAPLNAYTIEDRFSNVFLWLSMLSSNESIIIGIMFIVAIMNVIGTFLILILERTQMIGILKSMGMRNFKILQIFLRMALRIIVQGVLFGNLIGLLILYLQNKFNLIKLKSSVYYVNTIHVDFYWWHYILLNLVFVIVLMLILLIPAIIIKKIKPLKALKFE